MLDFIRHSRRMSTSRPSSLRSSIDEAQSKSASAHAIPFGTLSSTMPNPTISTRSHQASPHFSQGSATFSKPSTSFVAAQGEFHAPGNTTGCNENLGCVGQVDIDEGPRGSKNPHGLSLDRSTGYFPQGSDFVPGTIGQADMTQLSDRPSLEDFLRMIAAERLHHMPQKGSNRDRSIRALENFALKVSGYADRYISAVDSVQLTATMIYGRCYVLLQLGRSQATSVVPALELLAGVSCTLSLFTGWSQQSTSSQLQKHLGQTFDRTLDLLNGMTSYFQDLSVGLGTATGPSRLRTSLGKSLEAFDLQADQLLNELWTSHIPADVQKSLVQFKEVHLFLQPQDEVVRKTQRILLAERGSRHEFTCEWFSRSFLDFVRGSDIALWVDGRIGSGKSILCGWILESLQSPVDGREYAVVAHAIDPLLPSETNTVSVIKAILQQILKRQYGSGNLCRALANLMDAVASGDAPVQVQKLLWECLQIAIGDAVQPIMLVIDGLSELDGGDAAAAALFQNLLNSVAGNPLVRLLVLSRPFTFLPVKALRRRTIEARDMDKDIRRVITDLVPSHAPTPSVEIARRIAQEAEGNFFWSLLAFQEWTAQNFSQQTWKAIPASLDANAALLVSRIDFSDPMTCLVLFNSIIATRPLRLAEIEVLSRLDVNNKMLKPQALDVSRAIEQTCGKVLVIQDGIVLFRHALLKQALLETLQFGTLSLGPEMHGDMGCRLLLYIKLVLGQHSELTLKSIPSSAIEDLIQAFPLLSYALRYWTSHVVTSTMYSEPDSFTASSDCRLVFPETVYCAIVEASFFTRNLSWESLKALKIAASMRKEVLGNHEATLQTTSCLAEALQLRRDFTGAAIHFAVASELAQQILPEFHPFIATCMSKFLDTVDLADHNKISDFPSRKASVLRYMISMYETQTGPSSDEAIGLSNLLATHYATMQEYALSTEVYRKIHRLTIDCHGRDSSQAKVSEDRLVSALRFQPEEGGSPCSDSVYDDIVQTYDVTDARRINASIAKAESYRSHEDPFNAELVYISLWHGVTEACHRQRILDNHEKLLKVGVAFSKFLCEYGRMSDAQTVLLGLWSQQQALGYKSETTTALLEELATAMKHSGLQEMALEVLGTILATSELEDSSKCEGIRTVISDMTLDMVRGARSNSYSEAALRRVLEERISRGLKPSDASMVNALITELVNYDRFGDVVSVAAETLHRLWPAVMDDPYKLVPFDSNAFDSELASLATSLAQAYMKTNQMAGVGPIYWHLFQAARHSIAIDDSAVVEYANLALEAFKKTGQVHEIIALREDLLEYCIGKYGEDHTITIESRYALASLYSQEQLLEKAKEQYGSLWSMFVTKGPECGFDPSTSKALYVGYTSLLKKQAPVDRGALHEITEGYRSACLNHYGEQDSTTLEAVLKLAESWNGLHPGGSEAIQLYEWLVDRQECVLPDDTKAIIEVAESYLTDFYQMCIREESHKSGPFAGEEVSKREDASGRFPACDLVESCYLGINALTKQGSQDARATVIREIQLAIDSVIQSENQASSLYNAAVILATSCSANGFVEEGLNTVQRLTEQLIFEQGDTDQHVRRSNLVFLMAFEAHLTGSMVDFAEVHAKVLMESALWECYKRVSQTGTDPGLTLACGARLRSFLIDHNSLDRAALIEHDLYERFLDSYGAAFAQSIQTARELFSMLLQELNSERLPIDVPDIPSIASAALNRMVSSLLEEGQYMATLNISFSGFEFLQFVGAFTNGNNSILENGLWLGLVLVIPIPDEDIGTKLLVLSKVILQEILRQCRSQNFNFNRIKIDLISRIASVLGLQQNYEDLEWLLTRLWLSRKDLTSLDQDTIIQIGRRLVQVRFFHGHVDSAIELGEDIFYNVQRVYGTSHPCTVDVASLLSTMYAATGDHAAAKAVVGDSQLKHPEMKKQTAEEPNCEYLLQLYRQNGDTDAAPVVQQAPANWGFLDRGDKKGSGGIEHAK